MGGGGVNDGDGFSPLMDVEERKRKPTLTRPYAIEGHYLLRSTLIHNVYLPVCI
jgi:hypothetical protein